MKRSTRHRRQAEPFWPRVVMRKWLNIRNKDSDFSADSESEVASDSDSDQDFYELPRESRFKDERSCGEVEIDSNEAVPRLRRRKSETFRAQYISTKEIRVCVGTWNVGGKVPPDDLDLDGWLDIGEPADIYVLGFQEIIPLNAGNIFGAEDSRPILKWENIIRESLDKIPSGNKFKSFSDPPSPSRFKPSEDIHDIEEEIVLESDSEGEEEIVPINEEFNEFVEVKNGNVSGSDMVVDAYVPTSNGNREDGYKRQFSLPKRINELDCSIPEECEGNAEELSTQYGKKLTKTLSVTEKIGLCWPEQPLDILPQHILDRPNCIKSMKSFKASKSFRRYSSFNSTANGQNRMQPDIAMLAEIDLESLIKQKRRSPYVRIISKQMVGIFLTIWVRRGLRKHIQNLNVSTVGVGVMGYIGNKGSISVSMSIHQTLVCFVCTHLTSGEKDGDVVKRNADVREIHRRTHFNTYSSIRLPKSINDHEKIIWLGDLNYRINLSYENTMKLISKKDWSKLAESDQLRKELKKGRAFDGWAEGVLNFPPTYKYDINSDKYHGEDPRSGRRTPAWCDRILSYGKGMRLLNYRRSDLRTSDHRPVTASYMVEVEIFCPKKLQRALTFTDAEIDKEEIVTDTEIESGISRLMIEQNASLWRH
nr:type IV inositol polyphosphate 5-phosphatase 3 isoform X2 [Ipomoea batatas]